MKPVALRLPDEVSQRLTRLAELTGRSKTFYMIEAIKEHLDDLEDLYLAEQRLIDERAGKTEAVPLEEVMNAMAWKGEIDRATVREIRQAQPTQDSFLQSLKSCFLWYRARVRALSKPFGTVSSSALRTICLTSSSFTL